MASVIFAIPTKASALSASGSTPTPAGASGSKSATGTAGAVSAVAGYFGCVATAPAAAITGVPAAAVSVPVLDVPNLAQNTTTSGATLTKCIHDTVLIPIARAIARIALQGITASTINWINNTPGGSGSSPSYVRDLSTNFRTLGDSVALPFIGNTSNGFNSPFGSSISSSLRDTYLQRTSSQGFFSSNQSTLGNYSSNPNDFLSGDWSKGDKSEWFALTTQAQNNPYLLGYTAKQQLDKRVSQAIENRKQDLLQSGGFLSWCGTNDSPSVSGNASSTQGINPGDPCTDKKGKSGTIQTPGSIIHDYAQKAVVSSGVDQLVAVRDLDSALNAIVGALAGQVLGGAQGFFGASRSSAGRPSLSIQLQNYSANNVSASDSALSMAQSKVSKVNGYINSWDYIATAANTASTSVMFLKGFCLNAPSSTNYSLFPLSKSKNASSNRQIKIADFLKATSAQALSAQKALDMEIAPVLTIARAAYPLASSTIAFVRIVEAEASTTKTINSGNAVSAATLASDIKKLVAMPPSTSQIVNAKMNASVGRTAIATPAGSLTVASGVLIDRMNLIKTNADALKSSVCTFKP